MQTPARKKVLLIGASRRTQSAIVPALWCLQEQYELVAIMARSKKRIEYFEGKLAYETITSFDEIDLSKIDTVILSITIAEVPKVLRALSKLPVAHIRLIVDTPILLPKDFMAVRYFKKFREVVTAEDARYLPPFLVAKKLLAESTLGPLKHISFIQNGYKHHALASLEYLSGAKINKITSTQLDQRRSRKHLVFSNGVQADMIEPRDYAIGKFNIEGKRGFIADYALEVETGQDFFELTYIHKNGIYESITLNEHPLLLNDRDRQYQNYLPAELFEKTLMNTMKIRGLMEIINGSEKYSAIDAFGTVLMIKILEKCGFYSRFIFPVNLFLRLIALF